MISTFTRLVLHIYIFYHFQYSEDIVGQVSLTNDTVFNENEVTLPDDWISNICWKGQLSKQDVIQEDFFN